MAPLYACAVCQKTMRCKRNHVHVIETADFGPAAVWLADLWECPVCGHPMLAGFSAEPLAEHYEDDFAKTLRRARTGTPVLYC